MATEFIQGRGAQANVSNIFFKQHYSRDIVEGIDEWEEEKPQTQFTIVHPKSFVNKVDSPDVGMEYSANPYQGCEHGCIYCYARNSHQYWGYSAGLDFETKIMVKANSVKLFREFISRKSWTGTPISLSGNTDCYQPLERKFELTRGILKTASQYGQPISIITKNSLILRDADIISELSNRNLCMVFISINSLTEDTRLKLEPRTVTAKQRLHVIESLSKLGVPVGIMCAPVIPGLTDHEIPKVLKAAANAGAKWAGYTTVRLNGEIGQIFENWLHKAYPERANKIWHSIQSCHHGKVNDSEFGNRMKGTGKLAQMIKDSFRMHCKRNKLNVEDFEFDYSQFLKNGDQQLKLF